MKLYYVACIAWAIAANLMFFYMMTYEIVTGQGLYLVFNKFNELWIEWSITVVAVPGLSIILYKIIKGDA